MYSHKPLREDWNCHVVYNHQVDNIFCLGSVSGFAICRHYVHSKKFLQWLNVVNYLTVMNKGCLVKLSSISYQLLPWWYRIFKWFSKFEITMLIFMVHIDHQNNFISWNQWLNLLIHRNSFAQNAERNAKSIIRCFMNHTNGRVLN